jgi:hypothetical protein
MSSLFQKRNGVPHRPLHSLHTKKTRGSIHNAMMSSEFKEAEHNKQKKHTPTTRYPSPIALLQDLPDLTLWSRRRRREREATSLYRRHIAKGEKKLSNPLVRGKRLTDFENVGEKKASEKASKGGGQAKKSHNLDRSLEQERKAKSYYRKTSGEDRLRKIRVHLASGIQERESEGTYYSIGEQTQASVGENERVIVDCLKLEGQEKDRHIYRTCGF